MSQAYVIVLVFLVLALAALVGIWYYARRVKSTLDSSPTVFATASVALELPPATVARLRELSDEPILLKQGEEGVRVQIDRRPMLPLMAFVGQDVSGALSQAANRVSRQWGAKWVVVLTTAEDGSVSAQRLA